MNNIRDIENKISSLELQIFNIKVWVNSTYPSYNIVKKMIEYRKELKNELYHLKKTYQLRQERREKIKKLNEIC